MNKYYPNLRWSIAKNGLQIKDIAPLFGWSFKRVSSLFNQKVDWSRSEMLEMLAFLGLSNDLMGWLFADEKCACPVILRDGEAFQVEQATKFLSFIKEVIKDEQD